MSEANRFVKQGIKALKSGQKQRARALFEQALTLDEYNEMAWLWMSATTGDPQEQEICLENVITINPDNQKAQRGLTAVREKIAAAAPPPPPEPEPEPTLQTPESWYDDDHDLDFFTDDAAPSSALAERDEPAGTIFSGAAKTRTKRAKRKDRSLLDQAALSAEAAPSRGMLQLGTAWLSALVFDSENAYAAELPVATIGRTMVNVVIASIAATAILAIGFFVGLTIVINVVGASSGDSLPFGGMVVGGTNYAAQAAVISAPFLVIFFFALTFGMYLAAKLFGTKISFYDHAHLFSIAYAPTIIVLALLITLLFVVLGVIIGDVDINWDLPYWTEEELVSLEQAEARIADMTPILAGLYGIVQIYAIVVWAQALGTVHRNGIFMGVITAIVGLVISVACVFPATCCALSNMMSMR